MPPDPPLIVIPHATCLACGCLCDDITVTVAGGRVIGAERACVLGLPWFLAPHPGDGGPAATTDGRPVETNEALDRAAAILVGARAPVVWGLTGSSVEAVGAALAIADRRGATVDLAGSARRANHRAAFVRVGQVSSTLGEVRDRAEMVLFWGGHPDATHPRHAERYSVRRAGRFLAAERTVIVVDAGPAPSAGAADLRIAIRPEAQGEALAVLLALIRGLQLDADRVERATGRPLAEWADLADRLRAARWGAVFFGPAAEALGPTGWDRALTLVRDLNAAGHRFVGLGLGAAGNVAGAEAVACWQGGAPGHLDFGGGAPEYLPPAASLADRLRLGAADAVLTVGDDPFVGLPADLRDRLGALPRIEVSPGACHPRAGVPPASVAIATGRLGRETGGTVARVDGVMLPLRPPLAAPWPTDREILRALNARLVAEDSP